MTLAHELGHGVHQVLAGAQGALMCATPLTLAETDLAALEIAAGCRVDVGYPEVSDLAHSVSGPRPSATVPETIGNAPVCQSGSGSGRSDVRAFLPSGGSRRNDGKGGGERGELSPVGGIELALCPLG
eukprot:gene53802-73588_t